MRNFLLIWMGAVLIASMAYAQPQGVSVIGSPGQIQIACSEGEVLKYSSNVWACAADSSGGGSGSILDLGDDAIDESSSIGEIATTGDTNSIFTEPSADKLLINLGNNWPSADTADALSANGANCSAGSAPLGVDTAGAVEGCFDVEEESHASEHLENAADEILIENLGTACTANQIAVSDGVGGLDCDDENAHTHSGISNSGSVTLDATGGTNNENLTVNLETTANTADFTSTTGVTTIDMSDFTVKTNTVESVASATNGGTLTLCEDSDIGTDCVDLTVGQTDLPGGTTTITFDSNGRIPDSAVGDGVDDGVTLSIVALTFMCTDTDTLDATRYMVHSEMTTCQNTENGGGNDIRNLARLPYAGAVNSMTCVTDTAPGSTETVTFTARFQGSDTDCQVVISDTSTGPSSDTTCSTAYTATNYISISHVVSPGGADIAFAACYLIMEQTLP